MPGGFRTVAVLTQFNLEPPSHWNVSNRSLDDAWLEFRLNLLKTTSLPSLIGQTVQDFVWVIFIHPSSPEWLREQLRQGPAEHFRCELVEILGFDGTAYGSRLRAVLSGRKWLTIKLDSDDLLAHNFVERACEEVKDGVYCLEDGAYFDVKRMRAYRRHYPNNPFPFRIGDRGLTVMEEGHHVVHVEYPIRTKDPMWMQFHHGDNVSPDWHPLRGLDSASVTRCFTFPQSGEVLDPQSSICGLGAEKVGLLFRKVKAGTIFISKRLTRKLFSFARRR